MPEEPVSFEFRQNWMTEWTVSEETEWKYLYNQGSLYEINQGGLYMITRLDSA